MDTPEFRSLLSEQLRAFDRWAYNDSRENPSEYANYTFDQWFSLFVDFVESRND